MRHLLQLSLLHLLFTLFFLSLGGKVKLVIAGETFARTPKPSAHYLGALARSGRL